MSTINLSDELLKDIQQTLEKHDERNQDLGVGAQYLAAVIGVLVAHFPGQMQQRKEILQQLYNFSDEVMQSNVEPEQQADPGANDAAGIWKPGDN